MSSRTILFTWEIGQGFGHIFPLLPIARQFKAMGHLVIFALRDVRSSGELLEREGFMVLQAPFHPDRFFPANGPQPQTMADVLGVFGFVSKTNLAGLATAWNGLIRLCKPDLVVSSYAPLSLLCARDLGIPTGLIALPFELPPAVHPAPMFRTGLPGDSHRVDDLVVQTVNGVFKRELICAVHEIFRADATFLLSFSELDPFATRPGVAYCGSLFVSDVGSMPVWPKNTEQHKVFAYLNSDMPGLDSLRTEIQASPHVFCIYIRNANEKLLSLWRSTNVSVAPELLRLDRVLKECDAVLSYGSIGLVSASLLAGKPIVFCVNQLESFLNAKQTVLLGAGIHPEPQTPKTILSALNAALLEPKYRMAAVSFAEKYQKHRPSHVARSIADDLLDLIRI